MLQQIESLISNCNVCCKFQNEHQREPMISFKRPNERFYKVGVNIMTFKNIDYLVVVDYFSKFPEMFVLPDKTAKTVAEQLKCIFARFGIPYEIMSDNMLFQNREFLTFAKEWNFKTTTSSPQYFQSNGQVKRTIQTLKRFLKKLSMKTKTLIQHCLKIVILHVLTCCIPHLKL